MSPTGAACIPASPGIFVSTGVAMAVRPIILLVATLDTKADECMYLKNRMEEHGCEVLVMDTGTLNACENRAEIPRDAVARAGGMAYEDMLETKNKALCIGVMMRGSAVFAKELHACGRLDGIIGIGGAQGTDICTSAMRELPFGVPKFMVSTVASGRATFGPYVGTKDIIMMHSVADIQGINFLTRTVFDNAAAAICGMVRVNRGNGNPSHAAIGMSMLGTTTPGAMHAHGILQRHGYDAIAFHQNGTGGAAMEDLILEGRFKGVLDINLHELGDAVAGGLHGAIKDYRLKSAAKRGIPQVVAPGSVNYAVWGPEKTLGRKLRSRKYIVHNPQLTLVRISVPELRKTAEIIAERLSAAKGPVHVFIPTKGFSYPDREGGPHWEPESNEVFIKTLRKKLGPGIPYDELDYHINDREFIDAAVGTLLNMLKAKGSH